MLTPSDRLWVSLLLLCLLAFLWGASYPLIKIALSTIPPFTLMAFRVMLAAVILYIAMRWRRLALPHDSTSWRRLLVQSFFNSIGAWTLLAWGQQYLDSGLAGVLNSTSPLFVFAISYFLTGRQETHWLQFTGVSIGFAGVIWIIGPSALDHLGQESLTEIAVLGGAILYACAALYGGKLSHLPAMTAATGTMIWASLFLLPAALVFERPWQAVPDLLSILAALFLAVFSTAIALMIYFRLLTTLGSVGTASQSYLRAAIAVLIGVCFLGEAMTFTISAGIAASLLGVALINLAPMTKHSSAKPRA